jgi:DNA sulfur modification protein DndB
MDQTFGYVFPAIRGVQAGREYYVSMCPLRLIPKIFLFDEEELVPELRAQRTLNRSRVPEIARYIAQNKDSYIFSALTASVDADVRFESIGPGGETSKVGLLRIPMEAAFVINDGQHRRAAIELALREKPELADETIAVVFFLDVGLQRSQQMFADLNRYAIRPARSLSVLYDHRDDDARLAKLIVARSTVFRDVVEMEKSTLSLRSQKLFTLSAIYTATTALLKDTGGTFDERCDAAIAFWEEAAKLFPEWTKVAAHELSAGEVRTDFIHSHSITLHALGNLGNALLRERPKSWRRDLLKLKGLSWKRKNAAEWEGRAMIGGRVSKAMHNVTLTTNVLKHRLQLELSPEEQRIEDAFHAGEL